MLQRARDKTKSGERTEELESSMNRTGFPFIVGKHYFLSGRYVWANFYVYDANDSLPYVQRTHSVFFALGDHPLLLRHEG